jgi:calcineurin-like phosphoesterase
MCGDYDSVLGIAKEEPIRRFLTKIPSSRFEPATGEGTLTGVAVEIDEKSGHALRIAPLRLGGCLEETSPKFWE